MTYRHWTSVWCAQALLLLAACGDDPVEPTGACGDAEIGGAEACDDGNVNAGDGCSAVCSVEAGFACPPVGGFACTTTCGDQIQAGAEACDDGNAASSDGCSSECTIEEPPPEDCTDQVDNDRDGLADCDDADCASVCPTAENCTDTVDNDLDGQADCADSDCAENAACVEEPPAEDCASPGDEDGNGASDCDDDACTCDCGDGRLNGDEQCDSGDENSDTLPNACRSTCVNAFCGDTVVDTGEQCDGSAPAGSECVDCELRVVPVCGESGRYLDLTVESGSDALTVPLDFDSAAIDDFTLPASCTAINGRDITAQITVPVDGTWVLRLDGGSPNDRFAVSRSAGCDAPFATQCASASRGRLAELVMELQAASPQVLRFEATPSTTNATLTIQRVDEVITPGAACVVGDVLRPCGPGFVCTDITGATVCAAAPVMPGMVGESCSPGVPGECISGTECQADTSTCQPLAGTTCDTAVSLDDVMTDDGESFDVSLVTSTGSLQGTCESFPSVLALNLDLSRASWVQVQAVSSDESPVAVSARSNCGLVASEASCQRDASGTASSAFYLPGGGDGGTLLVSGFSTASLTVSRIPARVAGETCDVTGVINRCSPGLECAAGNCAVSLAGSCGDPLPGFLAAEGELTGRGLALAFDTATVAPVTRAACDTPLRRQVFTFQSPATGSLVARLGDSVTGAFIEVDAECAAAPALTSCELGGVATRVVRTGEFFDVSVSSADEVAGLVTLVLNVQSDVGETCSAEQLCLPGLECVAGRCQAPLLLPGAACVPGESVCTTGNACLPGEFGFTCKSTVAGDRQACETFAGLPTCIEPLVCIDEGGGKLCTLPAAPDCTTDAECGAGFRCNAGDCQALVNQPEGAPCDLSTANSCASGLVCTVGSGTLSSTCRAPVETCSETNPCIGGELCVDGTCYTLLTEGERCSPTAPPPCRLDLECLGAPGAEVCGRRAGGPGSECAATSECATGLFCNVLGVPGTCQERLPIGAFCNLALPDQCIEGSSCLRSGGSMFAMCTANP